MTDLLLRLAPQNAGVPIIEFGSEFWFPWTANVLFWVI